ncbi:MAG: hypothetical protein K2P79_14600 [Sphingomonas sp.]|nr:hypothetical protein [Sphingomonas sp.]
MNTIQGRVARRMFGLSAASMLAMSGQPALAQDAPKIFGEFQACRAIADATARLACFDRTAAAFDASVQKKELLVVEREEVRKTKRRLFGFVLDEKTVLGDTGDAETTQITTKITSVRSVGGYFLVGVDVGGTWQTTEPYFSTPRVGSNVTIKKAALGSFFMQFERGVGVRGKRVQ